MRIAIYGRKYKERDRELLQQLFDMLFDSGCDPLVHNEFFNQIESQITFKQPVDRFTTHNEIKKGVDYLISLGGDGTLLDTLALVRNSNIPILGINFGRLGFLASSGKNDIEIAIQALKNKTYQVDRRALIHLDSSHKIFDGVSFALNEFSIHKQDSSSMITVHTYLNGELLNSYWADGLIVATPTGSTGYSLSCGGPIIFPTSENFVITPIAPHNLNVRPIVVSDESVISFEVEGRNENFLVTLDSRYEVIDSSYQLAIRKETFNINLMRINDVNFMQTLREKLMWGADQRN